MAALPGSTMDTILHDNKADLVAIDAVIAAFLVRSPTNMGLPISDVCAR